MNPIEIAYRRTVFLENNEGVVFHLSTAPQPELVNRRNLASFMECLREEHFTLPETPVFVFDRGELDECPNPDGVMTYTYTYLMKSTTTNEIRVWIVKIPTA